MSYLVPLIPLSKNITKDNLVDNLASGKFRENLKFFPSNFLNETLIYFNVFRKFRCFYLIQLDFCLFCAIYFYLKCYEITYFLPYIEKPYFFKKIKFQTDLIDNNGETTIRRISTWMKRRIWLINSIKSRIIFC